MVGSATIRTLLSSAVTKAAKHATGTAARFT